MSQQRFASQIGESLSHRLPNRVVVKDVLVVDSLRITSERTIEKVRKNITPTKSRVITRFRFRKRLASSHISRSQNPKGSYHWPLAFHRVHATSTIHLESAYVTVLVLRTSIRAVLAIRLLEALLESSTRGLAIFVTALTHTDNNYLLNTIKQRDGSSYAHDVIRSGCK